MLALRQITTYASTKGLRHISKLKIMLLGIIVGAVGGAVGGAIIAQLQLISKPRTKKYQT